jgi:hypothetical protein
MAASSSMLSTPSSSPVTSLEKDNSIHTLEQLKAFVKALDPELNEKDRIISIKNEYLKLYGKPLSDQDLVFLFTKNISLSEDKNYYFQTKADGNCFFHAAYGNNIKEEYVEKNAKIMRIQWYNFLQEFVDEKKAATMPLSLKSRLHTLFNMFFQSNDTAPTNFWLQPDVKSIYEETKNAIQSSLLETQQLVDSLITEINTANSTIGKQILKQALLLLLRRNSSIKDKLLSKNIDIENIKDNLLVSEYNFLTGLLTEIETRNLLQENLEIFAKLYNPSYTTEIFHNKFNPEYIIRRFLNSPKVYTAYLNVIKDPSYFIAFDEIPILASLSQTYIKVWYREVDGPLQSISYEPQEDIVKWMNDYKYEFHPKLKDQWGHSVQAKRVEIYHAGFLPNGSVGGMHFSRANRKVIKLAKERRPNYLYRDIEQEYYAVEIIYDGKIFLMTSYELLKLVQIVIKEALAQVKYHHILDITHPKHQSLGGYIPAGLKKWLTLAEAIKSIDPKFAGAVKPLIINCGGRMINIFNPSHRYAFDYGSYDQFEVDLGKSISSGNVSGFFKNQANRYVPQAKVMAVKANRIKPSEPSNPMYSKTSDAVEPAEGLTYHFFVKQLMEAKLDDITITKMIRLLLKGFAPVTGLIKETIARDTKAYEDCLIAYQNKKINKKTFNKCIQDLYLSPNKLQKNAHPDLENMPEFLPGLLVALATPEVSRNPLCFVTGINMLLDLIESRAVLSINGLPITWENCLKHPDYDIAKTHSQTDPNKTLIKLSGLHPMVHNGSFSEEFKQNRYQLAEPLTWSHVKSSIILIEWLIKYAKEEKLSYANIPMKINRLSKKDFENKKNDRIILIHKVNASSAIKNYQGIINCLQSAISKALYNNFDNNFQNLNNSCNEDSDEEKKSTTFYSNSNNATTLQISAHHSMWASSVAINRSEIAENTVVTEGPNNNTKHSKNFDGSL